MTLKPYQPWYDDERDYNTNAPSYYDYLANSVNLEKVQTNAINELLVRDVDFLDSDEIHVDKITDWHNDDPNHQNKTSFKAHVITSPKTLTYSIDNVDYQASNALKVLDSGLYTPDYSQVISRQTASLNETSTTAKRAETKADKAQKTADTAKTTADQNTTKINSLTNTKQDKLTASGGIDLTDNNISLKTYPTYESDLNTLTETCIVKPNTHTTNLPSGASPEGILLSYVVRDVSIQYYVPYNNTNLYVRTGEKITTTATWEPWQTILNSTNLNDAIKTFNKGNNLQNPDIYQFHVFSNIERSATGDWGFEFFNDTSAKIYNVKIKAGTIKEANPESIIAQQSVSALLKVGVPQDFITKASNGYVFRSGYYLGDSLNRIAFELKTEDDVVNLRVKYYDKAGTITSVKVVQGHECSPIAIPYNNAISIEENSQEKPVDDSTNE